MNANLARMARALGQKISDDYGLPFEDEVDLIARIQKALERAYLLGTKA